MQIKTTMRHPITPVRWLSSINPQTSAGEDVEKGEPSCTAGGYATGAATVDSSMEFP